MTLAVSIAQSGANNVTMRNRIINGAMMIDQRNAGASVNIVSSVTTYTVDRWSVFENGSMSFTAQQSTTAPAGFKNSLLVTSTAAVTPGSADRSSLNQIIEGFNIADLGWGAAGAQPVTLSFWIRSSLTGQFGGALQSGQQDYSYPFSFTISSANTFEFKTITIPGPTAGTFPTDNNGGIRISFDLGMGSSLLGTAGSWSANDYRGATGDTRINGTNGATFYITGVQLEEGTTATAFEQRLYGTELALCQRYYQIIRTGMGLGNTTVQVIVNSGLPVTMRATPSLSQQGVVEIGAGNADRTQSSVSTTFLNGADNSVTYLLGNYTGLTVTAPYQFRLSANTNGVTASAEL
jgi:hypothetical protein